MHKYMELMNDLELLIGSGGQPYREGQKLPSVRMLSERYSLNKSTVIRALDELEKRHLIYSMPRSGYYVVKSAPEGGKEGRRTIDFSDFAPDPGIFPYEDFRHCINKAIDTYKNELFVYGTPRGLGSLIRVVRKQLAGYQVFAEESRIFITSGIQQALSLLLSIPFPNGKSKVLIEQPGYHLFIEQLQAYGIPVIGIDRNAQGIDLSELERIFRNEPVKFFYTIPRFHNPLGSSYSEKTKKRIAELAAKYDVYIVEDDYLADLSQDSKEDPIFAYDRTSRVIYLKSYSKIIFPGLRVGAAVIPEPMADSFNKHKRLMDIDSPMPSQAALEIYLKSGMFERHKQKIRVSYARKSRLLDEALRQHAAAQDALMAYHPARAACIHTHIELDERVRLADVVRDLGQRAIVLKPIDMHYMQPYDSGQRRKMLKLSVSTVQETDVQPGIEQLVHALRKHARN